jgi:hypothetical protein
MPYIKKSISKLFHEPHYIWVISIILSLAAVYIGMPASRDGWEYQSAYSKLNSQFEIHDLVKKDALFWIWMQIAKNFALSFQSAILPIICLSLHLKTKVLASLSDGNPLSVYAIYFLTYYSLHECTQLKISIALGFSMYACLMFTKRNILPAVIFSILGIGFHPTSLILVLIFLLCYLNSLSRKISWYLIPVCIVVLAADFSFTKELIHATLERVGGHYKEYIDVSENGTQNKSGLLYPYIGIIISILYFIKININSPKDRDTLASDAALATAAYGLSILLVANTYVAVAIRLSDILFLPLVAVLATYINYASLYGKYCTALLLIFFFFIRTIYLFKENFQNIFSYLV